MTSIEERRGRGRRGTGPESVDVHAIRRDYPEPEQSTPPHVGRERPAPATLRQAMAALAIADDDPEDPTNAERILLDQMLTYPYRAIGKVQKKGPGLANWTGQGSGVLVGPWHLLTASHVVNGDPDGTQYRFAPAYWKRERTGPGITWATATIVNRVGVDFDGSSGYDYVVCELDNPLGHDWGWWGTKGSDNDGFYTNATWNTIGYPGNLLDGQYPHKNGFTTLDVLDDQHNGKLIRGRSDIARGWSGGPLLGPGLSIQGDVVGVASGADSGGDDPAELEEVDFAGGPDMVRLVRWALDHWRRWTVRPENMTATFGYTRPKKNGGGVAACCWEPGRIDLFWRSEDDHLRHAWYPYNGTWSWEQDMTASYGLTPMYSAPAVVSDGRGRLDVFWRSADDHLRHIWFPGQSGDWSGEQDMTASFGLSASISAPTACSWELGRFDLFWQSAGDRHLRHIWYPYDGDWSWEQDMTASYGLTPAYSAPAAVSSEPGRVDLFWRSEEGHLRHIWYPYGGDWSWEQDMTASFGHGPANSAPAVSSWGPGRVDLLWRGNDGLLQHAWIDGHEWSPTEHMNHLFPARSRATPTACSWQPLRLDFFWIDQDMSIQHAWYANASI